MNPVRYIDTHCHIQLEQFDGDREDMIRKLREEGIAAIIVGDNYASSVKAVELAEKHEHLFAAVGIHPHNVMDIVSPSSLRQIAVHPKVVAIGECGLDYSRNEDDDMKQVQQKVFKQHIALAVELNKPLMIHARTPDAYKDLIVILTEAKSEYKNLCGVVHFFSGSLAEAKMLISLGFHISFTAVITFARDYDEIIKAVPLASILSETDAPYVAPASRRGSRNDPLAVIDVVAKIAEIRGEELETVRQTFLSNSQRLFALRTA